jgi:hypothetical protein
MCDPYKRNVDGKHIGDLLSVTKACRQTYRESALMFFDLNEFAVDGVFACEFRSIPKIFSAMLTDRQLRTIKSWTLRCCHFRCFKAMASSCSYLPELQKVTAWVVPMLVPFVKDDERVKDVLKNLSDEGIDVAFRKQLIPRSIE